MTHGIAPEARLGNDIARQFAHLPQDEAVERIAAHLARFWEPRMRARLRELVAAGDPDVDPLVAAAARRHPPG
ncbi:MAG TPA: formate dehydrogenase subunit delta [Nocardioides sp.]|uniref:formate dehydrogenase subunit delta n=1 Tax=Nocardioides sp. TaxID=35761 RepID=UPI002C97EE01|nr:formate dehydrogenase subunit delta [Nocardioides sp.]HQR26885.1 formate dehydrogenase subunit delta [Nocardioides sp.]